jgi:hypothetical protein
MGMQLKSDKNISTFRIYYLLVLWLSMGLNYLFVWCDWCLNSGLHTCKEGTSLLEPHFQSILL